MTIKKDYMNFHSYIILLEEFINSKVTLDYFEQTFLTLFKQEKSLPSEIFSILDTLFGYVDEYTSDPTSEDVNEVDLRQAATDCLNQLTEIAFLDFLNKDIDSGNVTELSQDVYDRVIKLT